MPYLDVITIVDILKSMWLKTIQVSSEENHTYVFGPASIRTRIGPEDLTGRISRSTNTLKFVQIILN